MRTGNLDGIINASIWQKVYDSGDLSSAQTSITISNLDGNTDEKYQLIIRFVNGYNGSTVYYWRPNNDSGANYGYQRFTGSNSTTSAFRNTSDVFGLANSSSLNGVNLVNSIIYAKSGYIRTQIQQLTDDVSGTTITTENTLGYVWNNTSDNITSLVLTASQTSGIGVGSRIILLRKTKSTSGQKTGVLNVQGRTTGAFQKIFEHIITDADAYTKLLLHFDGADAATAYVAETGQAVTFAGTAQLDTAQSKFGISSLLLDGNSDYITVPDSADFTLGTNNFTIDLWVRFNSLPGGGQYATFYSQFLNSSNQTIFYFEGSSLKFYSNRGGTGTGYFYSESISLNTAQWYHIELDRSGSNCYMFVDGISKSVTEGVAFGNITDISGNIIIGADNAGAVNTFLNGWIDEVRFSNGISRHTSSFTPETSHYTSKLSSLTISGLNGNSDVLYRIRIKAVVGYTGSIGHWRINNDTGTNYGYQALYAYSTTIAASRATGGTTTWFMRFASVSNAGDIVLHEALLYAKSGYLRPMICKMTEKISSTTVDSHNFMGSVWNNTSDNITSLVFTAINNLLTGYAGLAAESIIELEAYKA